ncbi:hypothetical protein ACFRAR_08000 [Kitasatospora sp. NPDC056651]|uniref:hypothetical protein n=1 Tax=Kitasatospora sp. NPDC056651 TaxID=3345892 RepID=UPI0036A7D6AF
MTEIANDSRTVLPADTATAPARRRTGGPWGAFTSAAEAAVCERVAGDRRHGLDRPAPSGGAGPA